MGKKWVETQIEGWAGFVIKEKLKVMRTVCKSWSDTHFNHRDISIETRKQNILRLDMLDDALGLSEDEVIERSRENALLLLDLGQKETVLSQRAKSKWIKDGDANTAFFHRLINGRRMKNEISGVLINDSWNNDIATVKVTSITTSDLISVLKTRSDLFFWDESFPKHISDDDNRLLTAPFSEKEIWNSICNSGVKKSPGPDGFSLEFIKSLWPSCKSDILNFFNDFHQNGRITKGLNHNFISLIPKKVDSRGFEKLLPNIADQVYLQDFFEGLSQ